MKIRRHHKTAADLSAFDLPPGCGDSAAPATLLGPRGGGASVWIDPAGWIAPTGASWSIDWRVRTGEGWESARSSRKTTQRLIGGASIETTFPTAVGSIIQRIAVGVVGGAPAVIVEFFNDASVAVALAVGLRPAGRTDSGVTSLSAGAEGIQLDGTLVLGANRPAIGILGASEDTFAALNELSDHDAAGPATPVEVSSENATANATLIWPLAHTTSLRLVIPLKDAPPRSAAVPAIDDIVRGWDTHLAATVRLSVEETPVAEIVPALARDLLCRVPDDGEVAPWMIGLTEIGLGRDAIAGVEWLSRREAPHWTVFAIGRLAQLGFEGDWREAAIEPLARAARKMRRSLSDPALDRPTPPGWRPTVFTAAAELAHSIGQPEIAAELDGIAAEAIAGITRPESPELVGYLETATPTWTWPSADRSDPHALSQSAVIAAGLRNLFVVDYENSVEIVPALPHQWRGRAMEAHQVPIAAGEISFGLRWHGSRPALLWEVHADHDREIKVRVPGISHGWETTDRSGESLLPDPGWESSGVS